MFFLIPAGQTRPSVLEKNKNEKYHLDFAKYCLGQCNSSLHDEFIKKTKLNKRFYKNDQWVLDEDLDAFFKDDTNQSRNRLKMTTNVIGPMVRQYRGNAIRMSVNFKVKSVSPQVINRREQKLAEMLFYTEIANQKNNPFGEVLKSKLPIGDNESQTIETFNNIYVDKVVQKVNHLLKYVSEKNELDSKQDRIAENIALSGLGVMKTFEYSGHQYFTVLDSENFFFDRSAKEYDLTDAEFMGEIAYMTVTEIFEMYPDVTNEERMSIEKYAQFYKKMSYQLSQGQEKGGINSQYENSGKVPVFYVYWKDGDSFEYAYVKDKYGYPYFTRINYIFEGEEKPRYTDKDIIEVKTERAKKVLKGQKKRRLFVDTLRTAVYVPSSIAASSSDDGQKTSDIILDWGIVPYQETENCDFNSTKFPYKAYCWSYIDGEITSPLDDAINPQRFINRMLSVAENQINNSRGSGIIYDKSMLDPNGGESEFLRNMNQSKPVGMQAKGRSLQNAVVSYDSTVNQGTMVMFNLINIMKDYVQSSTGVNEALRGESTGSDQLVGVTQLMIQRGSLMQEPFYNAITNIFKQCYQSIASMGKRIYADNERNIAIATGDEGLEVITITKDMNLEDFRCFVKRDNPDEVLVNAGNQLLLTFLQMGLIDDVKFAELHGRSTPEDISFALRQNAKEKQELNKMQAKQQQQQEAQDNMLLQNEQAKMDQMAYEQQAREDVKDLDNKNHDIKKELVKQLGKLAPTDPVAKNKIIENAKNLQGNIL